VSGTGVTLWRFHEDAPELEQNILYVTLMDAGASHSSWTLRG